MTRISRITLSGVKLEKQNAREHLGVNYDPSNRPRQFDEMLKLLSGMKLGTLDRKVKYGENLTFDESFVGACTVVAATNQSFFEYHRQSFEEAYGSFDYEKALAIAAAFLNLMATKESLTMLTSEEIAGMVAAASMDTVFTISLPEVVETCGMGGDRGVVMGGQPMKTINASTLSAFVLASLGLPVAKHGSYGNTSAVGSTEAVESFGAMTSMTSEDQVKHVFKESGFCFLDAHLCKTIHDLSHLLMMETINHIIGPMTPPFSSDTMIHKIMGVNEKVHPSTIVGAYNILDKLGSHRVGGVVAVSGIDPGWRELRGPNDYSRIKQHTILDEASPYASVVSVGSGSKLRGAGIVLPEDFGVNIDPLKVFLPNDSEAVLKANAEALNGKNKSGADYLAMNAALGLFAAEYAGREDAVSRNIINGRGALNTSYLKECFTRCRAAIDSGSAYHALDRYVSVSRNLVVCA